MFCVGLFSFSGGGLLLAVVVRLRHCSGGWLVLTGIFDGIVSLLVFDIKSAVKLCGAIVTQLIIWYSWGIHEPFTFPGHMSLRFGLRLVPTMAKKGIYKLTVFALAITTALLPVSPVASEDFGENTFGEAYYGEISATNPSDSYTVVLPEAGTLTVIVNSPEFQCQKVENLG